MEKLIIVREQSLKNLKARLAAIKPEFEDDEGAFEHMAEIQSVIDSLEGNDTIDQVKEKAAWVGLDSDLVWEALP